MCLAWWPSGLRGEGEWQNWRDPVLPLIEPSQAAIACPWDMWFRTLISSLTSALPCSLFSSMTLCVVAMILPTERIPVGFLLFYLWLLFLQGARPCMRSFRGHFRARQLLVFLRCCSGDGVSLCGWFRHWDRSPVSLCGWFRYRMAPQCHCLVWQQCPWGSHRVLFPLETATMHTGTTCMQI